MKLLKGLSDRSLSIEVSHCVLTEVALVDLGDARVRARGLTY